jgi:hypothetical protein
MGAERRASVVKPVPQAHWRIPLAGACVVLLFLALVGRFWHPVYGLTALFQLDASNDEVKLAEFRDLPVFVYRDTGGYDGLYYAQLALAPALKNPQLPGAMDNASYRARRILPSALAWLFGGGRAPAVVATYAVINVVFWLLLAVLLWRAINPVDAGGLFAWTAVLLSAGALFSVRLALTDLPSACLLTAALGAAEAMRKRTALLTVAGAALSRETGLLGVAGLLKSPWLSWKNAARIVLAALPLALWLAYVRHQFGPADQGFGNFSAPFLGWFEKTGDCVDALRHGQDRLLVVATALAHVGLTVQAAYLVLHRDRDDRWWRVGIAYVGLLLLLGTPVWEGHPGAATRVLLPMTIACNVLAARRRASWIWLICANLGILSGLLAWRDVPMDATEIAANRNGHVACIAHVDGGWYDAERTRSHTWRWAKQSAALVLETWPKSTARVRLKFEMRGFGPRSVIATQNGREVWRTRLTDTRAPYEFEVAVTGGRARIEFTTDTPARPENGGQRELGFALYDFQVEALR